VSITNYEDVALYPLDDQDAESILLEQNECSFVWGTRDHWPVGVIMNYVWRHGRFWLTATSQRARIRAIERDARVCIIVSSIGLERGAGRSLTIKGRASLHDDAKTKAWFYPDLARSVFRGAPDDLIERFVDLLDSERRLILEVTPEKWITYDASKMMGESLFSDTGNT